MREHESSVELRCREVDPEMKTFEVGKIYSEYAIRRDECAAAFGENGLSLLLLLSDPTADELSQVGAGSAGTLYFSDFSGIGCLIADLGRMSFDFPIHPFLNVYTKTKDFERCFRDKRMPLNILVFDSDTGKLLRIRKCRCTCDFSIKFIMWLEKMSESTLAIEEIKRLYAAYCSDFSRTDIIKMSIRGEIEHN